MKLNIKKKENIYLAPYTPTATLFAEYLQKTQGLTIKGYIDESKIGKDIYTLDTIKDLDIEKVFIISPNWGRNIYDNLSKIIRKKKLIIITKNDNNHYKTSLLNSTLVQCFDKILIKTINITFKYFNIQITKLWTNRIGELCLESEAFLYKLNNNTEYKKKNFIILSYMNEREISNNTLYNLYKASYKKCKNILLLEENILNKYLLYILKNKLIEDKYYCNIEQKSNAYNLFIHKKPMIQFQEYDVRKGKRGLEKLKIKKPFVCIFARDSQYLNTTFKYDKWVQNDCRDSDIDTNDLAIQYLIDKGYNVVRVGSLVSKELRFKHPKCIDYPYSGLRSDFMDIFLLSECAFAIGGHSGIMDICNAFAKVRLGVNIIPIDGPTYATKDDIYIPKKLKLNGEYLGLRKYLEIMNYSELNHFKSQTYEKLDIEIENNSSKEILMIVKEYLGDITHNDTDAKLLKKYYEIHENSKQFSEVKTKIGIQFLRDNLWYLAD